MLVVKKVSLVKHAIDWLPIALCLAFLLSLASLQRDRALRGENDFVQLYTGAKLAGGPDLYSRPANLAVVKATLGFTMETVVYTRPPFYAALLKPLSFLPYRAAYAVFSLLSLASILWFVVRFRKECPSLPLFASMSVPAISALCGGQDTPLLLAILGASVLLMRQNRDAAAGLVLSLVAIKFHLFLFLPVLLVLKKRWAMLRGAAGGTLVLTTSDCWSVESIHSGSTSTFFAIRGSIRVRSLCRTCMDSPRFSEVMQPLNSC